MKSRIYEGAKPYRRVLCDTGRRDSTVNSDLRSLVDGPNQAHLATLMPDGAPHCVPVWVGLEGERIAFLTSPTVRKARNVMRDPRVAISITDRDQPFTMATVRGRVVEKVEGDAAWEIIDRISIKYTIGPYPRDEARCVFLVQPAATFATAY
jgi:PPOX class probable F420-dependent enzyme